MNFFTRLLIGLFGPPQDDRVLCLKCANAIGHRKAAYAIFNLERIGTHNCERCKRQFIIRRRDESEK